MRYLALLLLACVPLFAGCSVYIARMGKDLDRLATREQVHADFGEPCRTGTVDGNAFEDYRTRRKMSERLRSCEQGMAFVMTFGVGELGWFPYELYLLGRRTLLGQEVRFVYDDAGRVIGIHLDGKPLGLLPCPDSPGFEPEPAAPPPSPPASTPGEKADPPR
jgi:YD repeat-containing protein